MMSEPPIRALVFDLDDTLYNERDYFKSGFTAVATALIGRGITADPSAIVSLLEQYHHLEGRSGVFQKLAKQLAFPDEWIPDLVTVFRSHRPSIQLPQDAIEVLPRLRKTYRLGCVTDGWAKVQRSKIEALGVDAMLDAIVIADDRGREFWKPHPRPFTECCALLGVAASEAIFIGDNPERDFVGAQACCMRFVWMRRPGSYFAGPACGGVAPVSYCEVTDLRELEQWLDNIAARDSRNHNPTACA